jgi:membrane protein YdbS with pleckstrin-like domain
MTQKQLHTYLLVQSLIWATLLIMTGALLNGTGYSSRIVELLLLAAVISVFVIPCLMRHKKASVTASPVPCRRRGL